MTPFQSLKLSILCSHHSAQQLSFSIENKIPFSLLPRGSSIPRASDSLVIKGYTHTHKLVYTNTLKHCRKYIAGYVLEYFECGHYGKYADFVSTKVDDGSDQFICYWECLGERKLS